MKWKRLAGAVSAGGVTWTFATSLRLPQTWPAVSGKPYAVINTATPTMTSRVAQRHRAEPGMELTHVRFPPVAEHGGLGAARARIAHNFPVGWKSGRQGKAPTVCEPKARFAPVSRGSLC